MSYIAVAIIAGVTLFVAGQVMSMRPSAEDRALATLRTKARALGLNPHLIPYPAWLSTQLSPNQPMHGMVAYYAVIMNDTQMPHMQALVTQRAIRVVQGDHALDGRPLPLKGAIALEMQSNYVGLYWDELQAIDGFELGTMLQQLTDLATSHRANIEG